MALVAVTGDQETHSSGDLICSNNNKVFVQGLRVANRNADAESDGSGHSGDLVKPDTVSSKVFVMGVGVHRNGDSRRCGAITSVSNQTKVTAG